jgi:Endodeoxyribonuclease RusA
MTGPALRIWVPSGRIVAGLRNPGSGMSQGSKSLMTGRDGKTYLVEAHRDTLDAWRTAVRAAALETWYPRPPLDGPLRLDVMLLIPPYASTPKRTRTFPCANGTGDASKLMRSIEDALGPMGTGKKRQPGIVYGDDAQIVFEQIQKDWAGVDLAGREIPPGALISVRPWNPDPTPRDLVGSILHSDPRRLVSSRPCPKD